MGTDLNSWDLTDLLIRISVSYIFGKESLVYGILSMVNIFNKINFTDLTGICAKCWDSNFTFKVDLRSVWEFHILQINRDRIHVYFSHILTKPQSIHCNTIVGVQVNLVFMTARSAG